MFLPKEVAGDIAKRYGHVPGCPMGMRFASRGHLYVAGVHLQTMKGIDSPWVGRTKRGTAKGGNRRAAK